MGLTYTKENDSYSDSTDHVTDNGKKIFTDVHSVGHPAEEAIDYVYEKGYMKGVSETEFAPLASATRAEAAKLLYEVLKAIQ